MGKSKVSFSIELLKMNLKHHKKSKKMYTFSKRHQKSWSKETADNVKNKQAYIQDFIDDLELAIKKLSSVGMVKKVVRAKKKKLPK